MTTIVSTEIDDDLPPAPGSAERKAKDVVEGEPRFTAASIPRAVLGFGVLAFLIIYVGPSSMIATLVKVVVAVALSAVVFIAANKLFDQAHPRWVRFNTLCGVLLGFVTFAVLEANGAFRSLLDRVSVLEGTEVTLLGTFGPYGNYGPYDLNALIWGAIGGVVLGAVMFALSAPRQQVGRLPLAVVGFALFGLLGAWALEESYRPAFDWTKVAICTIVGAAMFGGIRVLKGQLDLAPRTALTGVAVGYFVGAWGGGEIGRGNFLGGVLATVVPAALLGLRVGLGSEMTSIRRRAVDQKSRSWIFLVPALALIAGGLLLPLLRTAYLSFRNNDGSENVGGANYDEIFGDPNSFDVSNWTNLFTSQLFFGAVALIGLGIVAGIVLGARTRTRFERGGGSTGAMYVGVFLLAMAILTSLRGTVFNNIWWVIVVTTLSTSLGLAVAVLADRSRGENVAKSLIFLPMAISFVGAGIIWRFMYIGRPAGDNQTGVLNSLWVGLGQLSNSGWPKWVVAAVLLALIVGLAALARRGIVDKSGGLAGGSIVVGLVLAYVLYRLVGPGLGGFVTNADGEVQSRPVIFLEERPFNNIWLMVVLIWIQTGFAMVILSSAIKAVPSELTEAAKVDGASESQVFWKITVPQIAPTIGVVVTTLIVTVMKVFDIVTVMTGGQFGTEVIANDMISNAFGNSRFGLGSALAMVLFIAVLPVMFVNIRRMQKAKA